MYMQVMLGGLFYYWFYPNVGNAALAFGVGAAVTIQYARHLKEKSRIVFEHLREGSPAARNAL
jgi:hypothetical protein